MQGLYVEKQIDNFLSEYGKTVIANNCMRRNSAVIEKQLCDCYESMYIVHKF
jgi:hypothetical protein